MKNLLFVIAISLSIVCNSQALKINSQGQVGIGVNPNGYRLAINGTLYSTSGFYSPLGESGFLIGKNIEGSFSEPMIRCDDLYSGYGTLGTLSNYWGTIFADYGKYNTLIVSDYFQYSDSSLKSNIKPLNTSLTDVLKLQAVTYNYKDQLIASVSKSDSVIITRKRKFETIDKSKYGFVAQDLQKIYPNLVSKVDSSGLLGINYIGLIPILVEAIKEQNSMINELTKKVELYEDRFVVLEGELSNCCDKNIKKSLTTEIQENFERSKPRLGNNVPNPFNGQSLIPFYLPELVKDVKLNVYDLTGKIVSQNSIYERGDGQFTLDASKYEAGIYNYALIVDNELVEIKRMLVNK